MNTRAMIFDINDTLRSAREQQLQRFGWYLSTFRLGGHPVGPRSIFGFHNVLWKNTTFCRNITDMTMDRLRD